MAYNNSYHASVDEIVLPTTEFVGVKKRSKELGFVKDWVEVTVENEIWRGKQLRKEKPIPDDTEYEYNVSNIDFLGSFVNGKQHCRRRDHLKYYKTKTSPNTPRSKSPYPRPNSAASAYCPMNRSSRTHSPQIRAKNLKKCSMRIAELAVPTKRQLIDTWRNKSYILPEFMVERLKQHVMDQRPIVKIPEALNCFQKRKPPSSKTCSFKNPHNKNENNYDITKPTRDMDTRTLCILFAHKMAKILSKPLNLSLNLELENISRVVSSDIAKLLCKCPFIKNRQYLPIHTDVANKITVWIAGILEDLSLKLLEEDLRVKMQNEANAKNSEQFVTVMETILQQEKLTTQDTDLEEEEGPVLDFIDDLVENVLDICEPHPVYVESKSETTTLSKDGEIIKDEPVKSLNPDESTGIKIPKLEEIFNIQETVEGLIEEVDEELECKDDILSDLGHFRNEINNIIDYVTKESGDDMSNGSGDDIENVFDKTITPDGEMEDALDDDELNIDPINNDTQNVIQNNVYEGASEDDELNIEPINDDTKNVIQNNEYEGASEDDELNIEPINDDTKNVIQNNVYEGASEDDELNIEPINDDTKNVIQNNEYEGASEDDELNIDPINDDKQNVIQNNEYEEAGENAEVNDSNVSEGFEILSEDDDKNSKKVVFIKTGLVNLHEHAKQNETSADDVFWNNKQQHNEGSEHHQNQWKTQIEKSNIIFAEPNENLLSDADEPWPADLINRSMVNLNSVTKSVMSLGKINENDERQFSPKNEANMTNERKIDDTQLLENNIVDELTNLLSIENHDFESQLNKPLEEISKETTTAEQIIDSKTLYRKETDEFESQSVDEPSKEEVHQVMKIEGDNNIAATGGAPGLPEENKTFSPQTQLQIDYGWSKINENNERQTSPKDEADNIKVDTQLLGEIIEFKLGSLLTIEKHDSESQLNTPQQKTSIETEAELQVDSYRLEKQDTDEFESIPSIEEVNTIMSIDSDIVGTESVRSERNKIASPKTPQSSIDYYWSKIDENDETQIPVRDEADSTDERNSGDTRLIEKIIVDKLFSLIPTEQLDSENQLNIPKQITSKETTEAEPEIDSERLDRQYTEEFESIPSIEEVNTIMEIGSDIVRPGSTVGRLEDCRIPGLKNQSQKDYGWKVHLQTAPSWVTAWGQGRGEPSEESLPVQLTPTKVTKTEIRKWCQDLEKAFMNLEMWSHWLSNTCKETIMLSKQSDFACSAFAKRDAMNWIKLKRDINKDAILWTKLYQRTENNFICLKRKYNNIEFSSSKPTNIHKEILETFCEFENLSLELHKMIVAAEYCAICTCDRRKTR